MKNWSKDHWSLLAFIETQVVEGSKNLDHRRMRINDKKRGFSNGSPFGWQDSYGTRLKDGTTIADHDDLDVLEELEKEGLIENRATLLNPFVELTEKGWDMCAKIRKHKGSGGVFATFDPGK